LAEEERFLNIALLACIIGGFW